MKQLVAQLGLGVIPREQPVAIADDAGLVRGDGCFDATLFRDEQVYDLQEHLDRLAVSCEKLELPKPDFDAWRSLIDEAIAAWDGSEAALKLVVTRGPEHGGEITQFLTLTEMADEFKMQRNGVSVVTLNRGYASDTFVDTPWLLGGAKTLSYAVNVAAKRQATKLGAEDVVFTSSDGFVLEAPTASIIWRVEDRLYSTPHGATGILASISQQKVFERAAKFGYTAEFALGSPADIEASDGAWLLSSVRGVAPITTFDGVLLNSDVEVTERIRELNGF